MKPEDVPPHWVKAAAEGFATGEEIGLAWSQAWARALAAVAPLIAAAEREACAKVADEKAASLIQAGEEMRELFEQANGRHPSPPTDMFTYQLRATVADDVAIEIRARP